jgi:hypothetical protein
MDIKYVIAAVSIILLLGIWLRYRKTMQLPLLAAFLIALAWTATYRYEYDGENLFLLSRVNVYPLALWTLGLSSLYIVHNNMRRYPRRLAITIAIYLSLLLVLEFVGYRLLRIRLQGNYTSLLGLGIIHAPLYMKYFYLLAGPIYVLMLDSAARPKYRRIHRKINSRLAPRL